MYLVAAVNVSNDPTVALATINFMVCCIVLLKGFIVSQLYRKWPMDVLETLFILIILFFTIIIIYQSNEHIHREAISYTSVTITIILFLFVILYHVYTYTTVFSKVKKRKFGRMVDLLFTETRPKPNPRQRCFSPTPDDDIHRFDELLDELDCPVSTDDYNTIPLLRSTPVEPTYSVVDLLKPRDLAAPNPEVTNTQCIPSVVKAVQIKVNEAFSQA